MFIKGKDVIFYIEISGQYVALFHARTGTVNTTNSILPSTTLGSGNAETNEYSRKYAYMLKVEGLTFIGDNFNGFNLQVAQTTFTKINWTLTDNNNIQWMGVVLVTSTTFDANFDAISSFSGDLQGDGEYTFIQQNVPPIPPLGVSVNIIDQLGNIIAVVPAPGSYAVTKFDTIDLRFVTIPALTPITPQIVITPSA